MLTVNSLLVRVLSVCKFEHPKGPLWYNVISYFHHLYYFRFRAIAFNSRNILYVTK